MAIKKVLLKLPYVRIIYQYFKIKKAPVEKSNLPASFSNEFKEFKTLADSKGNRLELNWKDIFPILNQQKGSTEFDCHYQYHTAWAARCLATTKPENHTDISSSLYFAGIVSAFIKFDFYDFRPAEFYLNNLFCGKADLNKLPFENNSILSLSCMHVVEHIGLGRYGDKIDPDGDLKAISELKRVLAKGGNLLFVVPIAYRAKVVFNAHRIYTKQQILEYFSDVTLREFALISEFIEDGGIVVNPSSAIMMKQQYGCGCFWFTKN